LDARISLSSHNPDVDSLTAGKPRLIVLNRADQADPVLNQEWMNYFRGMGYTAITCSGKDGTGTERFAPAVRTLLAEKIQKYAEKGQTGRTLRLMILGIPNVGKSTLINRVSKRNIAKAEDRPGVTRTQQWVVVDQQLELLDTPGILWPKFDDPEAALRLAFTGAVKDQVMDIESLGGSLMGFLAGRYPGSLTGRYGIEIHPEEGGFSLLEKAGRKRGFLLRGGEIDTERMANILLDEFRAGKLGRFTLDTPPTENREESL
jgi:ribosome biogenesis GTPase A